MLGLIATPQVQRAWPSTLLKSKLRAPVPTPQRLAFVPYAKKKGAAKKAGGNPFKGKSSLVPEKKVTVDPTASAMVVMHSLQIIESYRKSADVPLLEGLDIAVAAKALFDAPFAMLTCTADETPALDYANKAALDVLGYNWDEFTELSAASIIPEASQGGWEETVKQIDSGLVDFQGPRLTKDGEEIAIEDGQGWPIKSGADAVIGYAVKWTPSEPEPDEDERESTKEEEGEESAVEGEAQEAPGKAEETV